VNGFTSGLGHFLSYLHGPLGFLGRQFRSMWDVLSAVAVNHPAPARNVLVYIAMFFVLAWAALRVVKAIK
jgi:hypothetical protein